MASRNSKNFVLQTALNLISVRKTRKVVLINLCGIKLEVRSAIELLSLGQDRFR